MTGLMKCSINKLSIALLHDTKARSSFCWKFFGNIVVSENSKKKILNPDQVYCAACLTAVKTQSDDVLFESVKIKSYRKTVSTGNLTRHLRDDHQIHEEPVIKNKAKYTLKDIVTGKRCAKTNTASCSKVLPKHDKGLLAKDIALWFSKSLLPFDSISDEGMEDFLKKYDIISKKGNLPSQSTVGGSALSEVYEYMLSHIKEKLYSDTSRHCALTIDSWTDQCRKLNYVTFTLHYLTSDFELKSSTLSTQAITENKTGERIHGMIIDVTKQFGLDANNIYAVIDGDSDVKLAVSLGNMEHQLCIGHGLHKLVTIDGVNSVPEVKEIIIKCKQIVKIIRYRLLEIESEAKKIQTDFLNTIDEVAEMLEIDESDPISQDDLISTIVNEDFKKDLSLLKAESAQHIPTNTNNATPTRWHIILQMLESIYQDGNRDVVDKILKKIGHYFLIMTHNEWILLEDLISFLKRFREAVEIISCQTTCTMNIALVFRSELIDVLKSLSNDEPLILLQLKHNMLANIDKRFPVTKPLVAAALLDTRFVGLKELDLYLKSQNMTKTSFLASYVREFINLDDLPAKSQINEIDTSVSVPCSSSSILTKLSKKHSTCAILKIEEDPLDQECSRYITSTVGSTDLKDDNLLSYWNEKKKEFPWLSTFARALLCVPCTNTPSDRMFSVSGLAFLAKRSRLSPRRVNKIIFIHDNYNECKSYLEK